MTAPLTPAPAPATAATPPSAVRGAVISGVIGGLMGAVMSAAVNYAAIGLPDSESVNALNHAISGLFSGFIAGFIGILVHSRKTSSAARAAEVTASASAAPQQSEPVGRSTDTASTEPAGTPVPEK